MLRSQCSELLTDWYIERRSSHLVLSLVQQIANRHPRSLHPRSRVQPALACPRHLGNRFDPGRILRCRRVDLPFRSTALARPIVVGWITSNGRLRDGRSTRSFFDRYRSLRPEGRRPGLIQRRRLTGARETIRQLRALCKSRSGRG